MLKTIFLPWLVIRDLRNELAMALNARDYARVDARSWEDTAQVLGKQCGALHLELAALRNPPRNASGKFAKRAA